MTTTYSRFIPSETDNPLALRRKMIAALILLCIEPTLAEIGWRPSQSEFTALVDKDVVAIQRTLGASDVPFDLYVRRVHANLPEDLLGDVDDDTVDVVTQAKRAVKKVLVVMHRQARRRVQSPATERELAHAAGSDRKD